MKRKALTFLLTVGAFSVLASAVSLPNLRCGKENGLSTPGI